jgi:hypothetical protein
MTRAAAPRLSPARAVWLAYAALVVAAVLTLTGIG